MHRAGVVHSVALESSSWLAGALDEEVGDAAFASVLAPAEIDELAQIRHDRRRLQAKAARCAAKLLWLRQRGELAISLPQVADVRHIVRLLRGLLPRPRNVEIRYRRYHSADCCPVLFDREAVWARPHVSLAHCGRFVFAAIGGGPIGCDVEEIATAQLPLLERTCSPSERLWVQRDMSSSKAACLAATRLWTVKEAWYKQHSAAHLGSHDPFHPQAIEVELLHAADKAQIRSAFPRFTGWVDVRQFVHQNHVFTVLAMEDLS